MGCNTSSLHAQKDEVEDETYYSAKHHNAGLHRTDQYFSQHQKTLLRQTWKIISEDQQNHGIAIFLKIFQRKPETKKLFPFGNVRDAELLQNGVFQSHATRFMHAVDTTIQNLEALEVALIPVLLTLGERHVNIEGFKEDYLELFMVCILEVFSQVLGKHCTKQVRDAWSQLGDFIVEKLYLGYTNAKQIKHTEIAGNRTVIITNTEKDTVKDAIKPVAKTEISGNGTVPIANDMQETGETIDTDHEQGTENESVKTHTVSDTKGSVQTEISGNGTPAVTDDQQETVTSLDYAQKNHVTHTVNHVTGQAVHTETEPETEPVKEADH